MILVNPKGLKKSYERTMRGGCYVSVNNLLQSHFRMWNRPKEDTFRWGFRLERGV